MGAQEPEWPEDGSLDDLVGALTAAGTRLPLSSGNPFGDGPVLAFVEFWKAMRDWSGRSNDWLAALVDNLRRARGRAPAPRERMVGQARARG